MITGPKILFIDDQWGRASDPTIPTTYGRMGFQLLLETAEDSPGNYSTARVLQRIRKDKPAIILLDVRFGRQQPRLGVDILEAIRGEFPTLPTLMLTSLDSQRDRDLVIRCMELGANEYLEKVPSAAQLQRVLEVYLGGQSDRAIYGNSPATRRLRADIARAAFSGKTSILVSGPSGSGKELVAEALHRQGRRRDGPFCDYNCAYQDSDLLESDLFGHVRGAFTGAVASRVGRIEEAHGGVLFLDEVASMPLRLQGKLLRVLETKRFSPVGGQKVLTSDFQLVCAINVPAEQLLREKKLREDFYFRIAALTLNVPSLSARPQDVPLLAEMFLQRFGADSDYAAHPGMRFSPDSWIRLAGYAWPGNVRELRNMVERALIRSTDAIVQLCPPSADETGTAVAPLVVSAPSDNRSWLRERLVAELSVAVRARRHVQEYKGSQWKAEFMRLLYPGVKAASAKGFDDLIKRLTRPPWGDPSSENDPAMKSLLDELTRR